jgi:hypothetical protein
MELGRWGRTIAAVGVRGAARPTGSSTTIARIPQHCDYAVTHIRDPYTRARADGDIVRGDRPTGWRRLRRAAAAAAVADFLSPIAASWCSYSSALKAAEFTAFLRRRRIAVSIALAAARQVVSVAEKLKCQRVVRRKRSLFLCSA